MCITKEEYNLLIKSGYNLEPYDDLCVVKAFKKTGDQWYREEYEIMLETAKKILNLEND